VSESPEPDLDDALSDDAFAGDTEEVDAVVVLATEERVLAASVPTRAMVPVAQAAAVAAGGFVAGAAVVGLVGRRRSRSRGSLSNRRGKKEISRAGELLQIVGSRSLLLDVHLLGGRD
jgi:hypothetical protein